jgi:hypothetical protein
MREIKEYIDEAKVKTGSDYATAQALKVERCVISAIRKRGAISDENAVKVAELIGVDSGEVLLAAAIARSRGVVKDAWKSVGKRAGMSNDSVYYVKFFAYAVWLDFCRFYGSFHMESKKWHDQKRAIFTNCAGIV